MYFKAINLISQFYKTNTLYQKAGSPIIMPMYHAIGYHEELFYLKQLYNIINETQFEQDLDNLLKEFTPIDLYQLISFYEQGFPSDGKKYMFLSFDDGLRNCYEVVRPILKRKGIPATFFLNTGFIDNAKMFHRFKSTVLYTEIEKRSNNTLIIKEIEKRTNTKIKNNTELLKVLLTLRYTSNNILDAIAGIIGVDFSEFLKTQQPYMSYYQVKELKKDGFTLGAHSVDHPEYYLLSETEQLQQTVDSLNYLSDNLDVDYKVFAFPFTDRGVNKSFFRKISNQHGCTLTFGVSGIKEDVVLSNLHRIPMDVTTASGNAIIRSELLHYNLKKMFGKHIYERN